MKSTPEPSKTAKLPKASPAKVILKQKVVIAGRKAETITEKPRAESVELMAKKNEELHLRISKVEHHDTEVIGSGYYFYKSLYQISRKEQVTLRVPDSLVFGFGFNKPTLIYTNEAGILQFRKGIDHYQYDALLDVFQSLNMFQSRQGVVLPLMIIKIGNGRFNRVLLRRSDAYDEWRSREKNPEQCVMQHYLLPKGRKACKMRAILRLNGFEAITISNKRRLDGKRDPNPKQSLIAACGTLEEARRLYGTRFQPITNNSKGHVSRAPERKEENPITVNATFDVSPVGEAFIEKFQEDFKVKIPLKEVSKSESPEPEIEKIQDTEDPKKVRRNKLLPFSDFEINSTRLKTRAEHYKEIEIDIEGIIEEQPEKKEKRKPKGIRAKVNEDSEEIEKLLADTKAGALETSNRINRTKLYNHLLKVKDSTGEDRAFERTDNPLPGNYGLILRERYCTDASDYKKTDIYEVRSKAMVEEVERQSKSLRSQIEKVFSVGQRLQLSELVCDFVEDITGNFWFLKLKSYSVVESGVKLVREISVKSQNRRRCAGSHCDEICPDNKFETFAQQRFQFLHHEEDLSTPRKVDHRRFLITRRLLMLDSVSKDPTAEGSMEALLKPQLLDLVEVCANCYKIYKLREVEVNQTEANVKRAKTAAMRHGEYLRKLVDDVNTLTVSVDQRSVETLPRFRSMAGLGKIPAARPSTSSQVISRSLLSPPFLPSSSSSVLRGRKKVTNKRMLD